MSITHPNFTENDINLVVNNLKNYLQSLKALLLSNKTFKDKIENTVSTDPLLSFFEESEILKIIFEHKKIDFLKNKKNVKSDLEKIISLIINEFYINIKNDNILISKYINITNVNWYSRYHSNGFLLNKTIENSEKDILFLKELSNEIQNPLLKQMCFNSIINIYRVYFDNLYDPKKNEEGINQFLIEKYQELKTYSETLINIIDKNTKLVNNIKNEIKDDEAIKDILSMLNILKIVNIDKNEKCYPLMFNLIKDLNDFKDYLNKKYKSEELNSKFINLINNNGMETLYKKNIHEKNIYETKINNILLPLINKNRESCLTLLKEAISRNKEEELELDNKINYSDMEKFSFIVNTERGSKKLNLYIEKLNIRWSEYSQDKDKFQLLVDKLKNNSYSIEISFNKELTKNLDEEKIMLIKEDFMNILNNLFLENKDKTVLSMTVSEDMDRKDLILKQFKNVLREHNLENSLSVKDINVKHKL